MAVSIKKYAQASALESLIRQIESGEYGHWIHQIELANIKSWISKQTNIPPEQLSDELTQLVIDVIKKQTTT